MPLGDCDGCQAPQSGQCALGFFGEGCREHHVDWRTSVRTSSDESHLLSSNSGCDGTLSVAAISSRALFFFDTTASQAKPRITKSILPVDVQGTCFASRQPSSSHATTEVLALDTSGPWILLVAKITDKFSDDFAGRVTLQHRSGSSLKDLGVWDLNTVGSASFRDSSMLAVRAGATLVIYENPANNIHDDANRWQRISTCRTPKTFPVHLGDMNWVGDDIALIQSKTDDFVTEVQLSSVILRALGIVLNTVGCAVAAGNLHVLRVVNMCRVVHGTFCLFQPLALHSLQGNISLLAVVLEPYQLGAHRMA